jgi:two-component system, NtrC family, sensor histidine kinase KinB
MTWTLRKKIILGYGIALSLVVLVLALALINLSRLGKASANILRDNYESIIAAEIMIDALERQDSAVLLILLGRTDAGMLQLRSNESEFLQWLGRAKDNITIEEEGEILNELENTYTEYLVSVSKLQTLIDSQVFSPESWYFDTIQITFQRVYDAIIRLRELNQNTMFTASDIAKRIARQAMMSMLLTGCVAIGFGLIFSLVLSKMVTRPLQRLMEGMSKLSEGEYDVHIKTRSSDELGQLAHDFNTMARKLKSFHDLNIERMVLEKQKSDTIINSIDDGLIFVDTEFRIVNINPAAAGVIDVDVHDAKGHHFLEVVNNDQLFSLIKQVSESNEPISLEEGKNIFLIDKGNHQFHYQFFITPVFSSPDSIAGVVLLLRDVTRLKELDLLKSQFVMTASHELRTPLMSAIMSIELLVEKSLDKFTEKERELLIAARDELHRLRVLVNDLLELSKIESGKIDMMFESISLLLIIDKAVSVLMAQAENLGIELSHDIPSDLPKAKADPNKITWVITNLVANAFRYTEKGGHIHITAECLGSQVQLSVKDDGPGIPYDYQSRIFDKFVQLKESGDTGGSGLGLAICKEIIHAHGGTIWVDSVPDEGSTFSFTIMVNHTEEEGIRI